MNIPSNMNVDDYNFHGRNMNQYNTQNQVGNNNILPNVKQRGLNPPGSANQDNPRRTPHASSM